MSLDIFGLSKMAQKDGIVMLSDACVADALSVAMGTCSAGVDADSPKMFPTAADLQSVVAPSLVLPPLPHFSRASSTSIASSLSSPKSPDTLEDSCPFSIIWSSVWNSLGTLEDSCLLSIIGRASFWTDMSRHWLPISSGWTSSFWNLVSKDLLPITSSTFACLALLGFLFLIEGESQGGDPNHAGHC